MRRAFLIAFAAAALASCATLDEDQCRAGDWDAVGFRDGASGFGPDRIYTHAKACNEHGIAPVRSLWEEGRQRGLALYCTPRNVYERGRDGQRLRDVCPAEDFAVLERANDRGLMWYRITREIAETEREIARINSRLADLPEDDPSRAGLAAERAALRLDLLQLEARRRHYRFY